MPEYILDSQIEEINRIIDQLGKFRINLRTVGLFGGLDNLSLYFNVRLSSDGKYADLFRKNKYSTNSEFINLGTTTTASNSSITIITDPVVTNHEREAMQEHHISKDVLIEVVQENKDEYIRQFSHLKELYETKLAEAMHAHMEGEIAQSQIMVTDDQGCRISLLTNMEDTFDGHLRALNLDSREVIVLTHEEYQYMVEGKDTNIAGVNHTIKVLEDQA